MNDYTDEEIELMNIEQTGTEEPVYIEPTPEEKAEMEKEEKIRNIQTEILDLQSKLDSSVSPIGDWKIIKCYEAKLQDLEMPYDLDDLIAKRQLARNRINELQKQLKDLE